MDYLKLIGIFLGATGFWRLVEILIKYRSDRKVQKAQAENLYAQAGNQIVESWVQWSQKLEVRVKELEDTNTEMKKTITSQRMRINQMEKHINRLENKNKVLIRKLEESSNPSL